MELSSLFTLQLIPRSQGSEVRSLGESPWEPPLAEVSHLLPKGQTVPAKRTLWNEDAEIFTLYLFPFGIWSHSVAQSEKGSPYVAQVGLKLLATNNPPASASQSAGITGENLTPNQSTSEALEAPASGPMREGIPDKFFMVLGLRDQLSGQDLCFPPSLPSLGFGSSPNPTGPDVGAVFGMDRELLGLGLSQPFTPDEHMGLSLLCTEHLFPSPLGLHSSEKYLESGGVGE
ncbi:hypothetical protein AAY473_010709 [Plecturocebus cupreus]